MAVFSFYIPKIMKKQLLLILVFLPLFSIAQSQAEEVKAIAKTIQF